MRSNLQDNKAHQLQLFSSKLGTERQELTGDLVFTDESPIFHAYDPNGADRTLTLPVLKRGRLFIVANVGTADNLVINDSDATEVLTVRPGEMHFVTCSGEEWGKTPGVFNGSGTGHSTGLVPDPGATAGTSKVLREDGQWVLLSMLPGDDYYYTLSDGTNTATAAGADDIRFRSSDSSVTVTVGDNDVTYGDNVDLVVDPANVDHDSLENYVADEHIDHTSVSITSSEGIQGGGDISANRTLKLDFSGLTSATPALADTVAFFDATDSIHKKALLSAVNAILEHDSLSGFVANEHIDHTTVAIAAGGGLTGGGTIDANQTISLDIDGQSTATLATADEFIFYDADAADFAKCTLAELNGALDHDSLSGFVANEHIDHSSVSISAGDGLSGGGDITTDRTLTLDVTHANTWTGAQTINALLEAQQNIIFSGVISPTSLSASQDDYAPTSLSTAAIVRLTSSADVNITGLTGGAAGRILILYNIGSNVITLTDEDGSSTAGNRFALNSDTAMGADQALLLQYDGVSSRWRIIGGAGGGGSVTVSSTEPTSPAPKSGDMWYEFGSGITPTLWLYVDDGDTEQWVDVGGGGISTSPLTTRGDLLYVNPSDVIARLPIGAAGYVLTSDGTDLTWDVATGFSTLTTRGDLLYVNSSGSVARLPVGSADQVLTADGTDVAWAAAASSYRSNIGEVFLWPGNSGTIPSNALVLNGTSHLRADYPDLWSLINTSFSPVSSPGAGQFGTGDGSTTFVLKNLTSSGYFIRCSTTAGTLQGHAFQGHWHQQYTAGVGSGSTGSYGLLITSTYGSQSNSGMNSARTPVNGGWGLSYTTETRPINQSMVPCIRAL